MQSNVFCFNLTKSAKNTFCLANDVTATHIKKYKSVLDFQCQSKNFPLWLHFSLLCYFDVSLMARQESHSDKIRFDRISLLCLHGENRFMSYAESCVVYLSHTLHWPSVVIFPKTPRVSC
ncbi:hypothetical protein ACOME3_002779 [Neoechinorhynchus agilis]